MVMNINITHIPKLYETEQEKLENKKAYLHFHLIGGNAHWYVCEAQQEEEDIIFFGYVKLLYNEWGYFSLKELETVPQIVLDTDFKPCNIKEVI